MASNERYKFIRKLGDGGMGEVYLVEHRALGRQEALKVLHKSLAQSQRFISRFRREARALNRLKHTHIVCVYDFGMLDDGGFYLSAEYADGDSLRTVLDQQGTLSPVRAVTILSQLASAVAHAHARGVIHRDLKPANLILERDHRDRDVLKVLDFGVAKIVAPDYQDQIEVTRQGSIYGTPAYMAPEQVHGEGDEPRIDIYAIGCLAFELVAGVTPFDSSNPITVMRSQVYDQPPHLSEIQLSTAVPESYANMVHKCLAKKPDQRFQTGSELQETLRTIKKQLLSAQEPRPPGRIRSSQSMVAIRPPPPADSPEEELEHLFEDVTTIVDVPQHITAMARLAVGEGDEQLMALQDVRLALAEHLLALGCNAVILGAQLNLVQSLQNELEQWQEESEALEQRRQQLEQRARHREATLRFSLGELRFEYQKTQKRLHENRPQHHQHQVSPQLARLRPLIESCERRLLHSGQLLQQDLRALDMQKASLIQTCRKRDSELDEAMTALHELLMDLSPGFARDAQVAAMLSHLRDFDQG